MAAVGLSHNRKEGDWEEQERGCMMVTKVFGSLPPLFQCV